MENAPVKAAQPKKIKCKKIYVDPVAILSITVAMCMLIMMCVGFAQLHQARQQVKVMETYVDYLQAEHADLTAQYKSGYDLEDIRRDALALNMIPAEQAAHVTIAIPAEPVQEAENERTLWEWIGTFFTGLFA